MSIGDLNDSAASVICERVIIDQPKKKFRFDIKKLHFKPQYLVFLFLFALLPTTVLVIKNQTSFRSRAYSTLPQTNEEFARNELLFMRSYYDKYIGHTADQAKLFENIYKNVESDPTPASRNYSQLYRSMCSQLSLSFLVKGTGFMSDDPYLKYFLSKWSNQNFDQIMTSPVNGHVRPVPAFDCLIALNLLRGKDQGGNDYIPKNIQYEALNSITNAAIRFITEISNEGGVSKYYWNRAGNYGNSQGEESGIMGSFLFAASRLLPGSGIGSITSNQRAIMEQYGKEAIAWSYSMCKWKTIKNPWNLGDGFQRCSIMGNTNLVINHQFDPSPDYTVSTLNFYTEVAMIFNQAGQLESELTSSSGIFSPMKGPVGLIATDLDRYINKDFQYSGPFRIVNQDGGTLMNYDYSNTYYTLSTYSGKLSSLPVSGVDYMNLYIVPNTNVFVGYIEKGKKVWKYTCDVNNNFCKADYVKSVSEEWKDRNIQDSSDLSVNQLWQENPLPDNYDAVSQFYLSDNKTLKTYVYKDNKMWHFVCVDNLCRRAYMQTLDKWLNPSNISNQQAAGWVANPPPMDKIDVLNQFVERGTNNIKSYIIRGNRVWVFTCNNGCVANYTKTLGDYFKQVSNVNGSWGNAGWLNNPPPGDMADAHFSHYVPGSNTLTGYVVKGDRIWKYSCSGGACVPGNTQLLKDYFLQVNQFNWPIDLQPGNIRYVGVSDWGRNATHQNSAYAIMYLLNPLRITHYQALQSKEIADGRGEGKNYFPTNFEGGQWNWDPLVELKNADFNSGVMDGSTATNTDQRINAHWTANMWIAKAHMNAYLALTSQRNLLAPFSSPPETPTPTLSPTLSPVPSRASCLGKGSACSSSSNVRGLCCNRCNNKTGRCR